MYTKKTTGTDKRKCRRTYTEDFKRKTVADYSASNMNLSIFSKQVGIEYTVIWKWIIKYGGNNSQDHSDKPVTPDDIALLKQDISRLKTSVEILKKIVTTRFQNKYN
jgi:transposase-like protein